MKNTLKTILQGVRLAIDKAVAKIPKKLSQLEIDVELGAQSWNDLEDRPFGEETVETVYFEGEFIADENGKADIHAYDIPFEQDRYLYIQLDGVEYHCQCREDSDACYCYFIPIEEREHYRYLPYIFEGGKYIKFNPYHYELDKKFIDGAPHSLKVYDKNVAVKQIDPKYIKDMYYEIPDVVFKPDFDGDTDGRATAMFNSTQYTWAEDKTYIVRVDGVKYQFDGMKNKNGGNPFAMKTIYYIGANYIPLNSSMDFTTYPFSFVTADFTNIYVVFEDATINHTVEFLVEPCAIKQIDPKYIPSTKFIVNFEETGWDEENGVPIFSVDKTFDEIYNAYQSGQVVEGKYDFGYTCNLNCATESYIEFWTYDSEGKYLTSIDKGYDGNVDSISFYSIYYDNYCMIYINSDTGKYETDVNPFTYYDCSTLIYGFENEDGYTEYSRHAAYANGIKVYFKNKTFIIDYDGNVNEIPIISSSVQPDWNQNDETAPDFIKGRPFYDKECVVFDGEVTFINGYSGNNVFNLNFKTTYKVIINDEVCTENGQVIYDDPDYYMAVYMKDGSIMYFNISGEINYNDINSTYSIKIIDVTNSTIHKIDEKYIPDTIASKDYVDEAVDNAGGGSAEIPIIIQYQSGSDTYICTHTYEQLKELYDSWDSKFKVQFYLEEGEYVYEASTYYNKNNSDFIVLFQVGSYYVEIAINKDDIITYSPYEIQHVWDDSLSTTNKKIVGAINEVNGSALKSPTTGEIGQVLAPTYRDMDGKPTEWKLVKVLGNSRDNQYNCALRITSQNISTNSGNIIHYTIKDMTGYIVCEFDSYQGVQGNFVDLNTTDKTIVGAINELKAEIEALKGN